MPWHTGGRTVGPDRSGPLVRIFGTCFFWSGTWSGFWSGPGQDFWSGPGPDLHGRFRPTEPHGLQHLRYIRWPPQSIFHKM